MSDFVQGQRWVVDSEPELGLGIVVSVEARSISIFFPSADCERRYTSEQAPLTRIVFQVDETVTDLKGETHLIQAVHDQNGLMIYEFDDGSLLPETQMSPEIQLNQPFMRLMMGQLDQRRWFNFRRALDGAMAKVWSSRLNGLLGVRASLIPHQLYVANSACERDEVRVLLSDEVGLGKTIEAGMILNRLLKLERIERAIIAVPSPLQVQWLVELIRRFAISPVLYNEASHDFADGQIHIVPHYALELEREEILNAGFDLAIVDEAHNIEHHSGEFEALSEIAVHCQHLVLMTATPEQLGFESHFSRLRLLDPAKYTDIENFRAEEQGYEELNHLIRDLPNSRETLIKRFALDAKLSDEALTEQVLDCHGVGRVVFRNARSAVAGFPKRIAHAHDINDDEWLTRYEWLAQFLKSNPEEKVLVITHNKENVIECESHLWQKHGIDAAVFHEDMDLIERDRAAAYFSDMEEGARVLLCSEIGSEGRNFQFSQHLVCLDLPSHPDVLEQRIGRLDRIGQTKDVNIHALISEAEESQRRWQWFHETLDCVARQNPAAGTVHDALWPDNFDDIDIELEAEAQTQVEQLREKIRLGRDALLEMNSCREPLASELAERIEAFEAESPYELVDQASNLLHFHFEDLGAGRYSLIPADNMLIPTLPGIPPEGVELTFDRNIANAREDLLFMTWDSPFILGLWELLHHSELGSACIAMLPSRQLPAGKCLLEACFDIIIQSEYAPHCLPFLESYSVRTLASDLSEKDLAAILPEDSLLNSLQKIDKRLGRQIIKSQKEMLPLWYAKAEGFAAPHKDAVLAKALKNAKKFFKDEIDRLKNLVEKNSSVSEEDIEQLEQKRHFVVNALENQSHLQLSALRLIVTNTP